MVPGEAEGYEKAADTYLERFARFVRRLREDLGRPDLPVLTAQLNRCMTPCDTDLDRQWGMVRQAQREAARQLENVWVVPAIDLPLYDFIHNSAQGNLVLGERMARCALAEIYGKELEWRAPEVERGGCGWPRTGSSCGSSGSTTGSTPLTWPRPCCPSRRRTERAW